MAEVCFVAVFILIYSMQVYAGMVSKKALFCLDPDTKDMHIVNTTWPSTTFCGNYTCKLRRKNSTDLENSPSKIINVTSVGNIDKNLIEAVQTSDEFSVTIEKRTEPDIQRILHKDRKIYDYKRENTENQNSDSYLTPNEIKTISGLLHTIKKSDLDAIVEIYNLAQDIYKELDKEVQNSKENVKNVKSNENSVNNIKAVPNKHISYWYNPTNHNSVQISPSDMISKGSNLEKVKAPYPVTTRTNYITVPYYYPMSNFQRLSSYVHSSPTNVPSNLKVSTVNDMISVTGVPYIQNFSHVSDNESSKPPCNKAVMASNLVAVSPWFSKVLRRPFHVDSKKETQPSLLLPYPFVYMHHHNLNTYPRNPYFNGKYMIYPQLHFDSKSVETNEKAVLINRELADDVSDLSQKLIDKREDISWKTEDKEHIDVQRPSWQTDPISADILNEVKANITDKLIITLPLKKKTVFIDKIGKVVNIDNLLRVKRQLTADPGSNDDDNFEAYLEKTTCETDTEPGYFARGHEKAPFPACCPQRIPKQILITT